MPERPKVEMLTEYCRNSMMTGTMKWFCRMSGKKKFTQQDIDGMQKTAAFRAADRNLYSWNMDFPLKHYHVLTISIDLDKTSHMLY